MASNSFILLTILFFSIVSGESSPCNAEKEEIPSGEVTIGYNAPDYLTGNIVVGNYVLFGTAHFETPNNPPDATITLTIDVYNAYCSSWTQKKIEPPYGQLVSFAADSYAFYLEDRRPIAHIFNSKTGEWSEQALSTIHYQHDFSFQVPRIINGLMIFPPSYNTTTFDIFNVPSGSWSVGNLPNRRDSDNPIIIGDYIGFFSFGKFDVYDTINNTWSHHSLNESCIYGTTVTPSAAIFPCEKGVLSYFPKTNSWYEYPGVGRTIVANDNTVILWGSSYTTPFIYDLKTNSMSSVSLDIEQYSDFGLYQDIFVSFGNHWMIEFNVTSGQSTRINFTRPDYGFRSSNQLEIEMRGNFILLYQRSSSGLWLVDRRTGNINESNLMYGSGYWITDRYLITKEGLQLHFFDYSTKQWNNYTSRFEVATLVGNKLIGKVPDSAIEIWDVETQDLTLLNAFETARWNSFNIIGNKFIYSRGILDTWEVAQEGRDTYYQSSISGILNVFECDWLNYSQLTPQNCPPKLSGGAIAGIVLGCLAFVALIIVGVVLFVRHRRYKNKYVLTSN
eukprot:TRINITY_DN3966_c0_g1_i2.p1 TRINITY_DN3966_c0_g1~~TRINITY_DN3966_c0_g1_i2.p1  ORF type:complete len:561 (-),score=112.18 TRINITY_DN3966_c0_g1_i2:17-1699(-)